MNNKLDQILEKIHSIDKTLDRNTSSLELHIKRTEILEAELKPLKSHVILMNNIAKIVVFLGVLLGIFSKFFSPQL